jgi:hypothetical protein
MMSPFCMCLHGCMPVWHGVSALHGTDGPLDGWEGRVLLASVGPGLHALPSPRCTGGTPDDEVITCPTLRDELEPRESPFLRNNYHGGGFTSDADRVLLQSVYFADRHSAGINSQDKLELLAQQFRQASFQDASVDEATSEL